MKYEKLANYYKVTSGGTPSRKNSEFYLDGKIPWVKTGDLKNMYLEDVSEFITERGLEKSSAKLFPKDTVLIAMYGATIGNCSILSIDAATNQACAAFLPNENILPEYLYYFFHNIKNDLIFKAVGGAQPNISISILRNIEIPYCSLNRQKAIVDVLNLSREIINKRKAQVTELSSLIQSTFLEMFGNPLTNNYGYKTDQIKNICDDIKGGGTPSKRRPEYYKGDIPWVTPKDMKTLLIKDSIDHINNEAIENSSTKLIPADSLLMVIRSGILKRYLPVAINKEDVTLNQDMKAFIVNKNIVTPEYLLLFFQNYQKKLLSQVRSVTADNLDFNQIKGVEVPIPPIEKQVEFSNLFNQINTLIENIKQQILIQEELYISLMQRAFKGELFND